MITPAKWQTAEEDQRIASKMSYGEFRKKLVPHMREVVFYPDTKDIFDIQLPCGITYFLVGHTTQEFCNIINKMSTNKSVNSISSRQVGYTLWNPGYDIISQLGTYIKLGSTLERKGKYICKICSLLSNKKMWSSQGNTVYNCETLIDYDYNLGEYFDLAHFDSLEEAKSCKSYIETKFIRFLMLMGCTEGICEQSFRFVPAPTVLDEQGNRVPGKFDHIYTDAELYKTWNLPQKYIDVIESVIKERA